MKRKFFYFTHLHMPLLLQWSCGNERTNDVEDDDDGKRNAVKFALQINGGLTFVVVVHGTFFWLGVLFVVGLAK